jgi:hypothetical protein
MRSVKRAGCSCHTMSALVCGLDVHKDSTYATILNFEGKIINQTRMVMKECFRISHILTLARLAWNLLTRLHHYSGS